MKAAPPTTISIKRKATDALEDDDGPHVFRIEDKVSGASSDSGKWIYVKKSRTATDTGGHTTPTFAPLPTRPIISASPTRRVLDKAATASKLKPASSDSNADPIPDTQTPTIEPLRYHLRRQPKPTSTRGFFTRIGRTKDPQVLFESRKPGGVEKRKKEAPPKPQWKVPSSTTPALPLEPKPIAPLRNVRQASGKVMPWDATTADLNKAMQQYTLDSIGATLRETTPPPRKSQAPHLPLLQKSSPSRFKPKAPAKRYHERHPSDEEARAAVLAAQISIEEKTEIMMDVDDEESYVIDEYVRMPAELIVNYDSTKSIGLLVLEEQEDLDVFYGDDSDNDSEIYDEEEDENAENHPSADYPEDEVSSDDEFNRNPYLYRKGNASDEEEFDENDATFSDDDDVVGSTTKSWSRKPPWMRSKEEVDEEKEAGEWH